MKRIMAVLTFLIMVMSTSCSVLKSRMIPEPNLTTDDSKMLVRYLLENHAGCRLPCWWGITPGKTTWVEARQILEKVSLYVGGQQSSDDFYANVNAYLPYPYDFATYMEHLYGVKNGVVDYIRIYNFNLAPNYSLANLLQSYGQPSEVWIRTLPKAERGIQHFIVDVFYGELGILVEYSTGDPMKEVGGNLQ